MHFSVLYCVTTPVYPQLIISSCVPTILQTYRDAGCMMVPGDDIRDIAFYRGGKVVVVGDTSRSAAAPSVLLKILEAATCKVVCVSARDDYDLTFLSRFATVQKDAYVIPNANPSALKVDEFLCDENRDMASCVKSGPAYLPTIVSYLTSRLPAKAKLLQ